MNQTHSKFKNLLFVVMILLTTEVSFAQKKPSKIWYRDTQSSNEVLKAEARNVVSDKEISKFKLTIHNNTNDFLILKPQETEMKAGSMSVKPNNKKHIYIRPLDSESKVIDGTNAFGNSMHEFSFNYHINGLYRAAGGSTMDLPDFVIPATQNVIEEGDFRIDLINFSLQSNEQWRCKFKVTYTGKGVGIVEPRKISARTKAGRSLANSGGEKAFALERGDSENFLVYITDNQPIFIMWNDAFVNSDLKKLDPVVLQFEHDPSKK